LEMVCRFFNIPADEMLSIGDLVKNVLFLEGTSSEEEAAAKLRAALNDMSKEHAVVAGMFMSGLLRCNLAQQVQEQYAKAMSEGSQEPE